MNLFDVVTLIGDQPDEGLLAGATGTIVHIFTEPDVAYEVEFSDEDGSTVAMATLTEDRLMIK